MFAFGALGTFLATLCWVRLGEQAKVPFLPEKLILGH